MLEFDAGRQKDSEKEGLGTFESCPAMSQDFDLKEMQQNQRVTEVLEKVKSDLSQAGFYSVGFRTMGPFLKGPCPVPATCPRDGEDYSSLSEKEFVSVLASYSSLAELSGLANRRRVLQNVSLAKWSPLQIKLIKQRKYELENQR